MRSTAEPLITIAREEVSGLPPAEWDQTIIATGPLTAPDLAEAISAETGQGCARLFRCHRADHSHRFDRHVGVLVPVAL
jgi:folate-dependent tRNA-U54 methylase TrmFO/GidA